MKNDKLIIGGHEFNSRFILGSGKYSMKLIEAAIKDAGAEIITLAVRTCKTRNTYRFFGSSRSTGIWQQRNPFRNIIKDAFLLLCICTANS